MDKASNNSQPLGFHVKELFIAGDLILAPMDGFSDSPFRIIARRLGSGASYTEFINALDILNGRPYMAERLRFSPVERPVFLQLLDNSVERLIQVALKLREEIQPDAIDINLGCCARTVTSRGAGAGLLRTPQLISEIFTQLSKKLDIPLTAKIRLGWDPHSKNYLEISELLEQSGCSMIAVHGRTRTQMYEGLADWDAIAEVKHKVSIPVVGNGDILCVEDIDRMKNHTRCDAVMIGRGAIKNPWIFSRMDRASVPLSVVQKTMLMHLDEMIKYYGQLMGMMRFRKFANGYLSSYSLDKSIRSRLLTCDDPVLFKEILIEVCAEIVNSNNGFV